VVQAPSAFRAGQGREVEPAQRIYPARGVETAQGTEPALPKQVFRTICEVSARERQRVLLDYRTFCEETVITVSQVSLACQALCAEKPQAAMMVLQAQLACQALCAFAMMAWCQCAVPCAAAAPMALLPQRVLILLIQPAGLE